MERVAAAVSFAGPAIFFMIVGFLLRRTVTICLLLLQFNKKSNAVHSILRLCILNLTQHCSQYTITVYTFA